MSKEGRTFFEVFSQGFKGKESKGSGSERSGEDIIVISEVKNINRPKRRWRGPYHVGLETIILGAVGGVLLAVGLFFLGLKLGNDNDMASVQSNSAKAKVSYSEKSTQKPSAQGTKVQQDKPTSTSIAKASYAPKKIPEKDTWSLRVISYKEGSKNLEKATSLASFLRERTGHNAFVARQGTQLVVCIGEFDTRDSSQLVELQKQVKELKYQEKAQFAGCYPVKLK